MKSRSLFWGLFLITLGILYLLDSYVSFYIEWYTIADWWPLIFIFWGLSVMFKNDSNLRPVFTGVTGFWLALILYTFFINAACCNWNFDIDFDNDQYSIQNYSEEYDNQFEEAELIISGGAGKFVVNGTTPKLVQAKAYNTFGDYDFDFYDRGSQALVKINQYDTDVDLLDFGRRYKNQLEVKLNPNPIWDLDVNVGAANTSLDLSQHKIKYIDLNTGASKTKIKLGNLFNNTEVDVEMGAASLIIEIPEDSGCKITGEMVLISKTLEGFSKEGHDNKYYITDNFDDAKNKIYVNVDGGVASLKVHRY